MEVVVTGSIGMGKSTITQQLRRLGFPVFDADATVHELYARGGAGTAALQALFPDVVLDGCVHRPTLAAKIQADPAVLAQVEAVIHPLVHEAKRLFKQQCLERGSLAIFFDIPLFFENRDKHPDAQYVVVVSAGAATQLQRVLARPGMTPERLQSVLAKQLPDAEKRARADFVVNTDFEGFVESRAQLAQCLNRMLTADALRWNTWKSQTMQQPQRVQQQVDCPLRRQVDAVVFDLDDTLVPVMRQLLSAHAAMTAYMLEHMPQTAALLATEMKHASEQVKTLFPLAKHDLREVRRRALQLLAAPFEEERPLVDVAVAVFQAERSKIDGNFYEDVEACFKYLKEKGVVIGIMSNGSLELSECPLVEQHCSFVLTASDVGCAKPDTLAFVACVQRAGCAPRRLLYVGDNYEHDVVGAAGCGLRTAFLQRARPGIAESLPAGLPVPVPVATTSVASVVPPADHMHTAREWATKLAVTPDLVLPSLWPEELDEQLRRMAE